MNKRLKQGFTLIELVVVMVIIGILAAIAIPQFSNVQQNASEAVATSICGSLQSAAVILYASNKTASTLSAVDGQVLTTGGTRTVAGSCASPSVTWAPSAGPTATVTCSAIPPALCAP